MFKAQAAAAPAPARAKQPEETVETGKEVNTQIDKTSGGRASFDSNDLAREGPADLAGGDTSAKSHELSEDKESIRLIAYQLWLDRGQPFGSPEVDWIEAVRICREPKS